MRELIRTPTLDGLTDQLIYAEQRREDDHDDSGELARQLVHLIVILVRGELVARYFDIRAEQRND